MSHHTTGAQHAAPLPLFLAARHQPLPRAPTSARTVLHDDLHDADGEPRACIVLPGRQLPLDPQSIPAALAALAHMEAAHVGR
jgi:hypothetical protein